MLRLAVYYVKHVMVELWCCSAAAAKEVAFLGHLGHF